MAKGGDTTTTTTAGDLPDYIKPYVSDVLQQAQANSQTPYTAYQGPRLADTSADTSAAYDIIRNTVNNPQTQQGLTTALTQAQAAGNYSAPSITAPGAVTTGTYSGLTPTTVAQSGTRDVSTGTYGGLQDFDFQRIPDLNIASYMDPYETQVLDVQNRLAAQNYQEQQAGRDAAAVQAGAFGGDRRYVQNSLAQRDYNNQTDLRNAQGLSAAYNSATALATSDEARRLEAFNTGQDRSLSAYQQDAARALQGDISNADRSLTAAEGYQNRSLQAQTADSDRGLSAYEQDAARAAQVASGNADRSLQAQTANAAAANAAANTRVAATQAQLALLQGGQNLALSGAGALAGVGAAEQAQSQAGLDLAYQDYLRQQNYPADQLATYAGIVSGIPVANSGTTTQTGPAPNVFTQLGGLVTGLVGLGSLV